jgi:hypothetical protein
MCIPYNGIDYNHGFSVTKHMQTGLRCFDVLVTKHANVPPYRYSGICLNNGYQVCTNEYTKSFALLELFEKIVGDTIVSETEYAVRYPGESFIPLVNVELKAPDVYGEFSVKMKDARLLDEYRELHKELKPLLEKPHPINISENTPIELSKWLKDMLAMQQESILEIVYDCKDMNLLSVFTKNNEILKDCEIKYARV